jgi:membrane protease YdiL (CAAX protease family)
MSAYDSSPAAARGTACLIGLHLVPGVIALGVYLLIARPIRALGYPSMMPWLIVVLFVTIPFELGWLLYEGKRRNGRISLEGIVVYRAELTARELAVTTGATLAGVFAFFVIASPASFWLDAVVFDWLPEWFILDTGTGNEAYSPSALWTLSIASLFVFVFAASVVEELYFRGYLLPRLAHLGMWAVPFHSFLFALYHFTRPWQLVMRTLTTIPLAYAAQRTESLLPSMIVHAVANSVGVMAGIAYLLSL